MVVDEPDKPTDPAAAAARGSHGALCAIRGRGVQAKTTAIALRGRFEKTDESRAKGETVGYHRFGEA